MLDLADAMHRLTEGVLDAATLPLTKVWDWKIVHERLPSDDEIAKAMSLSNWNDVHRKPGKVFLTREGMGLDFGGFGKEYAVDQVIAIAKKHGVQDILVDLGRDIFAIGGNPEAAALSGINTRMMTVKIFTLMGGLAGIAAVIGAARQNSATNAMGNLDELYVIAAAVVGGTSLAGGVGTIYGAIIGALILTSLQTGMVLIGFGDGSYQRIVIGVALVLAVWLDIVYRKRIK
jgi:predicted ABC-type sugar transport system permease subunit